MSKILSERTRTSDQPLFMEEQFVAWATVTLLVTWATYSYVQVMHRSKVKRRESCKRHVQRLESLLRAVSLSGRAKKYQGGTSGRRERTFLPRLSLWRLHKFTRSLTMPNSPSYSNSDNLDRQRFSGDWQRLLTKISSLKSICNICRTMLKSGTKYGVTSHLS